MITLEGKVFCRYKKPQLLHLSFSHVIAVCSESGLDPWVFVSQYYRKETVVHTWGHEIYGIGSLGSFATPNISPMYIPNPDARRGIGRRQTLRIRNGMDESEAGKKKKKDATCVEQMVTLTRSALKCKKIMLVLRLELLEIPPMDCLRILDPVASRFRYVCICI